MSNLSFFTPVSFGDSPKTFSESLLQSCDSYLSLRGEKAYVVKGSVDNKRKVVLFDDNNNSSQIRKTALKVISYFFIVLPALAFVGKIILRATHSFHVIDVEKELREGVESSLKNNLQKEIKPDPNGIGTSCLSSMEKGDTYGKITLLELKRKTTLISSIYAFTLSDAPGYIFRTAETDSRSKMSLLLNTMVKAKKICLIYNLDRLVIPNIKAFKGSTRFIIAETTSSDKKDIKEQLKGLTDLKPIEQLAVFLLKSHFYISEKNIALNDDKEKNRSISLSNLEDSESNDSFIGNLIQFLGSEEQIDAVTKIALSHGLVCNENAIKERKKVLAQIKAQEALLANRAYAKA